MLLGSTNTRGRMDMVFELVLIAGIVAFSVWLSYLSWKMNDALDGLGNSEEQLDEIKEAIELVGNILNRLPELMPQFNMNTNPLQPIFEAFAQKLSGQQPLMTYNEPPRGADGQYGTKESEEEITT